MRIWHPDVCKDPRATEMCKKINTARDVLLGEVKSRNSYHNYSYDKSSDINLDEKKAYYMNEVEKLFIGAVMIDIDGEQSNFAMIELFSLRFNVLDKIELEKSCLELERIFYDFKSKYLIGLYKYLYYYCLENFMSLEALDSYNYKVDKKYTINIDRNVYNVYYDFERVKAKRNIFKKVYSKIKTFM